MASPASVTLAIFVSCFQSAFTIAEVSPANVKVASQGQLSAVKEHDPQRASLLRRDILNGDSAPELQHKSSTHKSSTKVKAKGRLSDKYQNMYKSHVEEKLPSRNPEMTEHTNYTMPHQMICRYGSFSTDIHNGSEVTRKHFCPMLIAQDTKCNVPHEVLHQDRLIGGTENPLGVLNTEHGNPLTRCAVLAAKGGHKMFAWGKDTNADTCIAQDPSATFDGYYVNIGHDVTDCVGEPCCLPARFAYSQWDLFKVIEITDNGNEQDENTTGVLVNSADNLTTAEIAAAHEATPAPTPATSP